MEIKSNIIEAHIFRKIDQRIEFLALKRSPGSNYPDIWQMVTGAIHDNEKAYETALREISEETTLSPIKFWILPNINSYYSVDIDSIIMIPVFAAQVDYNCNVSISEEHSEYKWVGKKEMIKLLAWPGQKKSVETLFEYFSQKNEFIDLVEIKINKENR